MLGHVLLMIKHQPITIKVFVERIYEWVTQTPDFPLSWYHIRVVTKINPVVMLELSCVFACLAYQAGLPKAVRSMPLILSQWGQLQNGHLSGVLYMSNIKPILFYWIPTALDKWIYIYIYEPSRCIIFKTIAITSCSDHVFYACHIIHK